MVRYFLPELHSSDISIITAVTNLRQEASFGNKVATRVRRLISLFMRSSALVVLKRRRCPAGKANTANPSGSAEFELRDDNYAQIETLATAAGKKGYGYRLYLTALAALGHGIQLIPQACQDSDVCLGIWYKFYMEPDIIKTSLNGTKHYRFEFDATYSHELAGLNPDIICEQWDAWEITDDIYTHVKSGELNPHPSNVSFTLPEQRRAYIAKTVTPYVFTAAQIEAWNKCLRLDYKNLGAPAADNLRQGVSFPAPGLLIGSPQTA